nr:MAG TPA: hypothetical protein [Caudoviricetes sp.]
MDCTKCETYDLCNEVNGETMCLIIRMRSKNKR